MTYVYILRCADRSFYVGHTSDPDARKQAHDEGTASNHTAKRRPLEMVYVEACASLADAVHRERQLKRWSRAKKEALIAGDTNALHALSRRSSARQRTTIALLRGVGRLGRSGCRSILIDNRAFSMRELRARVRAQLRRAQGPASRTHRFGECEVDFDRAALCGAAAGYWRSPRSS